MTHIILTTETADEMKAILDLARKNKFKFKAVSITENDYSTNEDKTPLTVEEEDQALAKAMDEGRTGNYVAEEDIMKLLKNSRDLSNWASI